MVFQPGQSGNPAGRPKGSVNRQLAMLRAATEAVLPLVLARALGGDTSAQELILKLGMPKLKPIELPIEFSLGEGEAAPTRAVLAQAAAGMLPLSHAKEIMTSLLPELDKQSRPAEHQPSASMMNAYLNSLMNAEG